MQNVSSTLHEFCSCSSCSSARWALARLEKNCLKIFHGRGRPLKLGLKLGAWALGLLGLGVGRGAWGAGGPGVPDWVWGLGTESLGLRLAGPEPVWKLGPAWQLDYTVLPPDHSSQHVCSPGRLALRRVSMKSLRRALSLRAVLRNERCIPLVRDIDASV